MKDGKYYYSSTSDLEKRLIRHNQGRVKSTKPRIPFFWFTSSSVLKQPVLFEVLAPAFLFYKEAMCEGSTGNGLLYAAKAVP